MTREHATSEGATALTGWRAYLVALPAIVVGLGLTRLLEPLTDEPHLAPLVFVVALLALTCGPGPSLVAVAVGWTGAALLLGEPGFRTTPELMRWLLPLVVALLIVGAVWHLRRSGTIAVRRAALAEESSATDRGLQQLATALSAAATPSEVAYALVSELPGMLGASGGSLGLVEGDELVVVDPGAASRPALQPGLRLPLTARAPITTAARTGEPAFTTTRQDFERRFPDGARLATYAAGALAVPLRAEGKVVGSMGFPFAHPHAFDDSALTLAEVAASLGGQALERSMLYERELAMREGLERIARLAPRFAGESVEAIVAAVCAEARQTFAADSAQVWTLTESGMEVLCRDPPHDEFPPGSSVDLSEFPGLDDVIRRLEPVFERDVLERARGAALERVTRAGTRSVLRVPVVVHDTADRVLSLVWRQVVAEPTTETLALARSFGDHAGLALEQAERRLAQHQAARSAAETRRLLDATAAIAAATTPSEVAEATLDVVSSALGSVAGGLVRITGAELEIVAANGFTADELASWQSFGLDADAPVCRAISESTVVTFASRTALAHVYPEMAARSRYEAWVAAPVTVAGRPVGGLALSFAEPRELTTSEVEYVSAVGRQAGQALQRATLHELERTARVDAELAAGQTRRLQNVAERLTAAATVAEVADVVVAQAVDALAADAAVVYALDSDRDEVTMVGSAGFPAGTLDEWRVLPTGLSTPVTDVVTSGWPLVLETSDEFAERYPLAAARAEQIGHRSSFCYPLTAGGRTLGAVYFMYRSPTVLDDESADLARTIFRQGAVALDRSLRFEAELVSRRRSERLQVLSSRLSGALAPADVAAVFLDEALDALGADAGLLGIADEETRRVEVLDRRGFPDVVIEHEETTAPALLEAMAATLRGRRPVYHEKVPTEPGDDGAPVGAGRRAYALLPLTAAGSQLGVAVIAWTEPTRIVERERAFIEALVGQCALALDRAQRYENERMVAETLQRAILPETLPSMEGVRVAARYLPGTTALDVGGDWFDTLTLPDGRLGFVVGDVVGKGVQAASTMAQLRNGMRALTLENSSPAETVTKLNTLIEGYTDAPFATLVYMTLDPAERSATLISAGHLPPLVMSPDGHVDVLEGVGGLPLGVEANVVYEELRTTLEPGSTVVLYTDGLIERRTRSIDDGIALLVDAARRAPRDPDAFVDAVVGELLGDEPRGDDVAVLAVRLDAVPLRPLDVTLPSDPASLRLLRDDLQRWLERASVPDVDARDVQLAVWEATANAIEHAGAGGDATVRVTADLAGDRVRVEVRDRGRWREPRPQHDRGLGLRLIEALMSGVDVTRDDHGTTIVMERPLTREPARSHGPRAPVD